MEESAEDAAAMARDWGRVSAEVSQGTFPSGLLVFQEAAAKISRS